MAHKYDTSKVIDSIAFTGATFTLRRMTEGRRLELRTKLNESNKRIREIMKSQADIEKQSEETRDHSRWLDLQDEFDGIMLEKVNPAWVQWGVKRVDGLEVDDKILNVEDWKDWPSAFFSEVLEAVKDEAELNGAQKKPSPLPTTSGPQAVGSPSSTTATTADEEDTGKAEFATDTSRIM